MKMENIYKKPNSKYSWKLYPCLSDAKLRLLSTGGADETQGRPHQADEWDSQWHQGAEALRLGNLLQGEDPADPTEGAECAAEDGLPQRSVHHGLDQCAFSGEASFPSLIALRAVLCIWGKCKMLIFDMHSDAEDPYLGVKLLAHVSKVH